MRRVLILVNLKQRDSATDNLLATKLRERGFDVRVADYLPHNRQHVLFYKPNIVIGPEARCEYSVAFYKQCKEWGIYTIAKRTEGGAALKAWEVMSQDERDTVIGKWPYDVDMEIVWSEDFKKLMLEHGYLPEEKIFVAGALPFDVYFIPPFHTHPEKRKNLVFATGWGHADRNPIYNVPEAPPGSSIHEDAYRRHRQGRTAWINMMHKVIDALRPEGWDFYLRLKVGEHPAEYQDKLKDKIKIIVPCDTKTVLLNTDLLIHAGSTMAIEAHLCNIPALSFYGRLNQTEGYDFPHVSPEFENVDDLIAAIKSVELRRTNANTAAIDTLSREFYGVIDGKATERIADKIKSLALKEPNIPDEWPADKPIYEFPDVVTHVEQWICETCGRPSFVTRPGLEMIKCPWCGISLAKRMPPVIVEERKQND